ncbi:IclR family transcriptional regulator [Gilvimarinus polysaccharolyticus]|uniref:IclR family transcriptional regulator n=1 Tax=Gilvimarinus polysaccharolyticus TaxID=863921 RepID=UPI000673C6BA|nr:IclR family transcriptional regulator [Gilvimarinus polysaccharolyticus]
MTDKTPSTAAETDNRKYKAPALEKGLDILELLAASGEPLTTSQMATQLGRSVSELFRMVLALEYRGYIVAAEDGRDGYTLSNKLFTLGIARAPTKTLLQVALPEMSDLARQIGQSCHLAVVSGDQVVVIGRIENPGDLGFSVRVGYRRPLLQATSGRSLFGFQSPETRALMLAHLNDADPTCVAEFVKQADETVARGYVSNASDFVDGVTDLSAPILGARGALAAITVPYVKSNPQVCSLEQALEYLQATAKKISQQMSEYS